MSLSEEIKQSKRIGKKRGNGRQAFLALKSEISKTMQDGYRAKEIWEHLHEKGVMPVQYRTFIDYVNRYVLNANQNNLKTSDPIKAVQVVSAKPTETKQVKAELNKRFSHNAKGINLDDWI